jgi:polyisoprenoid-binding protein YceI
MQEHFNENYVESEVYPKAVFKGRFDDGRAIGALTIHGVTQDINVPAALTEENEIAHLLLEFEATIEEFGIAIPGAVANKIDKQAKIQVDCKMQSR